MVRALVAVIVAAVAVTLDGTAGAYLPVGYATAWSLLVALVAFAAIAWAFVPRRNAASSCGVAPRRAGRRGTCRADRR